nr:MAG TPA: hypothetical protein [Caudoviricetes sp.]
MKSTVCMETSLRLKAQYTTTFSISQACKDLTFDNFVDI